MQNKNLIPNILITAFLLALATLLSFLLFSLSPISSANTALLYILVIVLIGRYTTGYLPGIIASLVGVICVNYLFTYPYFRLNFTLTGYPITFIGMLAISLITSTLTTNLKKLAYTLAEKEKIINETEKEKMRANLLRSISHDLRTPLTSIICSSSSLVNSEEPISESERKELSVHIYEDANWLLNMVENILSVTKIQGTSSSLKKTPEVIEEVLSESVQRLKKRLPDAKITTKLPEEFLMIPMDALLIEQVIINLLENAVTHSESERPIELFVTTSDTSITIHVKDYGIGISITPCDNIFDLSSLPETTADAEKGKGIGLSICKTIIMAHNGEIHARNHEDGSEFYFSIPKE
ncbi:osmosensitive K+ channel histidine kinase KdpD [Lachnospiraceae bacterium KM106-2]|nr:osmosensitive K+ channel histidine kinase KdpD [Lachnospiraceae bacterium KM106-2]